MGLKGLTECEVEVGREGLRGWSCAGLTAASSGRKGSDFGNEGNLVFRELEWTDSGRGLDGFDSMWGDVGNDSDWNPG